MVRKKENTTRFGWTTSFFDVFFFLVVRIPRLLSARFGLGVRAFGHQQHGLDVRYDAALRHDHVLQQPVQLLVVADGQLHVPGRDAALVVVARRVTGQLEHLGRQVLEHGRHVHGRFHGQPHRILALLEQPVHAAHGERDAGLGRTALGGRAFRRHRRACRHDRLGVFPGHVAVVARRVM